MAAPMELISRAKAREVLNDHVERAMALEPTERIRTIDLIRILSDVRDDLMNLAWDEQPVKQP